GIDPSGELAGYITPTVQEGSVVRAFGPFDAPMSARHSLGARVVLNATSLDPAAGTTLGASGSDALDLLGTIFLASTLNDRWWNHAQLGITRGSLERDSLAIAPLLLVPGGLRTTTSPSPRDATRMEITARNAFGARY